MALVTKDFEIEIFLNKKKRVSPSWGEHSPRKQIYFEVMFSLSQLSTLGAEQLLDVFLGRKNLSNSSSVIDMGSKSFNDDSCCRDFIGDPRWATTSFVGVFSSSSIYVGMYGVDSRNREVFDNFNFGLAWLYSERFRQLGLTAENDSKTRQVNNELSSVSCLICSSDFLASCSWSFNISVFSVFL